MKVTTICLMYAAVTLGGFSRNLLAHMQEKTGTFGGLKVTYKVVLPSGYDSAKRHSAVLVFTGGPQTLQIATSTVETDCITVVRQFARIGAFQGIRLSP